MIKKYQNDLYGIYRSEVMGEAMFSLMANLSLSSERKQKWKTLSLLEAQTKKEYFSYLKKHGVTFRFPLSALFAGKFFAMIFSLLPWSMAMKGILSGADDLIIVFTRLRDHADDDDKDYFNSVVSHEKAIREFSIREINGEGVHSLQPVLALLSSGLNE